MDPSVLKKQTEDQGTPTFDEMLRHSINKTNQLQIMADEAVEALASGQRKDIHNTMIAMEKADIAFKFLMEIRNKVISAYETIMRLQV